MRLYHQLAPALRRPCSVVVSSCRHGLVWNEQWRLRTQSLIHATCLKLPFATCIATAGDVHCDGYDPVCRRAFTEMQIRTAPHVYVVPRGERLPTGPEKDDMEVTQYLTTSKTPADSFAAEVARRVGTQARPNCPSLREIVSINRFLASS